MRSAARRMPPSPRRRTTALFGLRITFSGMLCTAIVVLVGLAALNSEANLLFLLFGISLGIVGFSALAPTVMVRRVEVERIVPGAVVAGRPFTIVYCVRNRRRWLRSWSLLVGEIPVGRRPPRFPWGFVEALDPGAQERIELTGVCPARGRVSLAGVRLLSRFPFGLFACNVDVAQPAELVVYPAVGRFRRDPWRDRHHAESASSRSSPRESRGLEDFYGVREYRPGDNLRWIHWRRSARLGQLIVREHSVARVEHLTVLLDPWPEPERDEGPGHQAGGGHSASLRVLRWRVNASGRPKRTRLAPGGADRPVAAVERIINLAATALCEGLERGHRVGLIARGAVPVVIAPSGGRSHRQRLLHELALLRPGAPEGLDALISRIRWSSGWHGRCMVCTTRVDPAHTRVMRFLAGRAEAVVAISSDSATFDALFDVGAGSYGDSPPVEDRPVTAGRPR